MTKLQWMNKRLVSGKGECSTALRVLVFLFFFFFSKALIKTLLKTSHGLKEELHQLGKTSISNTGMMRNTIAEERQ